MSKWQPIGTAPREEWIDMILVARDKGKRAVMPAVWDGERWQSLSIIGIMEFINPTHWMPLPEPPK